MQKIEFSVDVKFGDAVIDSIEVEPLGFLALGKLWRRAEAQDSKAEVALQRERILHQAHFMAAGKRVTPDAAQLGQLPFAVAKAILAELDHGQGKPGKVLGDGDGITAPVLYQLGAPVEMKNSKGDVVQITELEFQAATYGEVEDVLAAGNEIDKAIALLSGVAAPVQGNLTRLPGWALDRITTADGLAIMRKVLPRF